ncbi:hypothetical protein QUB63_02400 [Microcoleus sp. ARI1-B5]
MTQLVFNIFQLPKLADSVFRKKGDRISEHGRSVMLSQPILDLRF